MLLHKQPTASQRYRKLIPVLCCAAGLSVAGCTGKILEPSAEESDSTGSSGPGSEGPGNGGPGNGGPGNEGPGADVPPGRSFAFTCSAGPETPPSTATRRLTRDQLVASVRALLDARLGALADSAWVEISVALDRIPRDIVSTEEDFTRMSQAVGQSHVDAWFAVGRAVAGAVTANADRRRAFIGSCAEAPNRACVEAFVRSFGRKVFRRPVTTAELQFFVDTVYEDASGVDAWSNTITALLASPPFLYAFEIGTTENAQDEVRRLTPYELAARLALHFWRTGPDDALLDAAESGRLSDPESYRAEVRRVFEDPRTRATLDAFVVDWLDLHRVPDPSQSLDRADFIALAGENPPYATLRAEAIQEVLDLVRHHVWSEPSSFADLMTSTLGFARTPRLAALYGLDEPWQEGDVPLTLGTGRPGPLTRVALLLNDQATTRPIIKGVRVRNRFLCDDLRLPANMDDIRMEVPDRSESLRQKIETLTEQPGSTCQGCHSSINAAGFALEGFDPIGRARQQETRYDDSGELEVTHPIDSEGEVNVDGRSVPVQGAGDLARWLSESDQARACFARKYVRFTFGRQEALDADGCLMESIRSSLESGATLASVFESIALHPAFAVVRK